MDAGFLLMRLRSLLSVLVCAGSACTARDPCIAAHQRLIYSPSRTRRLNVFTGPCPHAAPQVLVEFDHGAGGSGVLAVADSSAAFSGRWISDDSAEIFYPLGARVVKQESVAQYGSARVFLRYSAVAGIAR